MDNYNSNNPFNNNLDSPIPLNDTGPKESGVSHSPLDLGGGPATQTAKMDVPKPPEKKATVKPVSANRITGVKTFFTKLHAGAIDFLDEQICEWLKANPDIDIKRTNTVTGEVQGKKTEPNIIITVWY